jgi:hypothetical protein
MGERSVSKAGCGALESLLELPPPHFHGPE